MPNKALKGMADKAGVSLKKAEKYWKDAEKAYNDQKKKPKDKFAYIMGIVKKRLGSKSEDLVLCGVDPEVVLEVDTCIEEDVKADDMDETETAWATLGLCEFLTVSNGGKSNMVTEEMEINPKVLKLLSEAEGVVTPQEWNKWVLRMFPNVNTEYLKVIMRS